MAENKAKEYKAIEELKGIHNTSDAVFEGVKAANGWKTGKMVTVAVVTEETDWVFTV